MKAKSSMIAVLALVASTACASAQSITAAAFDRSFNSTSKRIGTEITLTKVGCKASDPGECEYGAVPDLRVVANGSSDGGSVEQVSAYLPRDAMDRARSQRSAVTATAVATTLIGTFSPSIPTKRRGEAVMQLLTGATGPLKRGEIDLGGVNYVLSATQADNLRIYVRR